MTAPISTGRTLQTRSQRSIRRAAQPLRDRRVDPLAQLLDLFAAASLDEFIDTCFLVLPRIVDCDFVSALYRSDGGRLLRERDSRGRDYSPQFMKRYAELTPAVNAVLTTPGVKVLPSRVGLPSADEELHRSAFYREVMEPQGWRHAVALCFWNPPAALFPSLVISLNRVSGRADFSNGDLKVLGRLHDVLQAAATRIEERENTQAIYDAIASAVRYERHGFMVVDSRLHVVRANLAAKQMCRNWWGTAEGSETARTTSVRVPTPIFLAIEAMRKEWQDSLTGEITTQGIQRRRINVDGTARWSASITMLWPKADGIGEPAFVVEADYFDRLEPVAKPSLKILELRLTRAEHAVAVAIASGLSNQEAAESLGKTVAAVKFLLHRIYQKHGIGSRTQLVAWMTGTLAGSKD